MSVFYCLKTILRFYCKQKVTYICTYHYSEQRIKLLYIQSVVYCPNTICQSPVVSKATTIASPWILVQISLWLANGWFQDLSFVKGKKVSWHLHVFNKFILFQEQFEKDFNNMWYVMSNCQSILTMLQLRGCLFSRKSRKRALLVNDL